MSGNSGGGGGGASPWGSGSPATPRRLGRGGLRSQCTIDASTGLNLQDGESTTTVAIGKDTYTIGKKENQLAISMYSKIAIERHWLCYKSQNTNQIITAVYFHFHFGWGLSSLSLFLALMRQGNRTDFFLSIIVEYWIPNRSGLRSSPI